MTVDGEDGISVVFMGVITSGGTCRVMVLRSSREQRAALLFDRLDQYKPS